jgi:hypothetical protein
LKNILKIFPKKQSQKQWKSKWAWFVLSYLHPRCSKCLHIYIFSHKVVQCDGRDNTLLLVEIKFYSLKTTHEIYANLQILNMPNCHMFWWWWKFVVIWITMITSCFYLWNYFVVLRDSQSFKMTPFSNNLSIIERKNNMSTHEWPSRIRKKQYYSIATSIEMLPSKNVVTFLITKSHVTL